MTKVSFKCHKTSKKTSVTIIHTLIMMLRKVGNIRKKSHNENSIIFALASVLKQFTLTTDKSTEKPIHSALFQFYETLTIL